MRHRAPGLVVLVVLRSLFLLGILVCVVRLPYEGQWRASLRSRVTTWLIDLEDSPVWSPPAVPPYAAFKEVFHDIPAEGTPGMEIQRALEWRRMLSDFLFRLWAWSGFFGVIYLCVPRDIRDPVLHFALWMAIGLTAGAIACVGFSFLIYFAIPVGVGPVLWAPVWLEYFGAIGLIAGIVQAVRRYPQPVAAPSNLAS